jgi:hypothetical protein
LIGFASRIFLIYTVDYRVFQTIYLYFRLPAEDRHGRKDDG